MKAVAPLVFDVEQGEDRVVLGDDLHGIVTGLGREHVIARFAQAKGQGRDPLLVVVDDQDLAFA